MRLIALQLVFDGDWKTVAHICELCVGHLIERKIVKNLLGQHFLKNLCGLYVAIYNFRVITGVIDISYNLLS